MLLDFFRPQCINTRQYSPTTTHNRMSSSMDSPTNVISESSQALAAERARVDVETTDERDQQLLMAALQKLSLDDLPNNTRVIVPPTTHISSEHFNSSSSRVLVTPDDLVVIQQSSKAAWFTLTSGKQACRFFYDAGSDNLVLQNIGQGSIDVSSIDPGNNKTTYELTTVRPLKTVVITPGPWRIRSGSAVPEILVEFLLLRRRYNLTRRYELTSMAGSKRTGPSTTESSSKRRTIAHGNGDRSILLFNYPSQVTPHNLKQWPCQFNSTGTGTNLVGGNTDCECR